MALQSAAEIAVNSLPLELPEFSDAELGRDYVPGFPSTADPREQIATPWGFLTYREAVARERSEHVARKRRAIEERKLVEERKAIAQAEARARQEQLATDAKGGRGRAALKAALTAYQEALDQSATLESALAKAKGEEKSLRIDGDVSNDKFVRALASARDTVAASEIRMERAIPLLQQAAETLQKAILAARAEFMFLHAEERSQRLNRALEQISSLFDKVALQRLRISFQELAATSHQVVALDQACHYQGYRHFWMDLDAPIGRDLSQKPVSSSRLIQGTSEVEDRFVSLDRVITSSN
jgi:pentose-5-phosphate-3-epimerase